MNFICNIFTTLLFYLTPSKVLFFCFFPCLLPSPVCALYLFSVCALTPWFLHSPSLVQPLFTVLSLCVCRESPSPDTLYGCYSPIILFTAHLLTLLLFFFLSVPPSIYIPRNQCLIHPISTFLLSYVYSILPAIFPFLYPDNTYSVCCELVSLNLISFSLAL